MKSCFRYLLFLLPVFVFNSCSNEIDVLADYEESAAIYGLLDPYQPIQLIKINKVFTNPGARAGDIAKISDSLYFDTIAPVLVELDNGVARRTIPLFRANILLKDSGTFANSPNYMYATNVQIFSQYKYRLDLRLPKTNKYVTATTNMVSMKYSDLNQPVYPFSIPRYISIPPTEGASIILSFKTGLNGKIYDAFFNFNYMEINKSDTSIRTLKSIRWKILRSFRALADKGQETVSYKIPAGSFYDLIMHEIPVDPNVTRQFMPSTVEFIGGNLELDNYIEASIPSIGIVQKQTEYTNIINGVGIFASRSTLVIDQVQLSAPAKTAIRNDAPYKQLNFE
jgi:hypothetical protein